MRRLIRGLVALCSAASLLLCVAACVLWVRSYEVDVFNWFDTAPDPALSGLHVERHDFVFSKEGTVRWSRSRSTRNPTPIEINQTEVEQPQFPLLSRAPWREPSFAWEREPSYFSITVPYWALVVATLPFPAAYLWSARRPRRSRLRHRGGLCTCGYDLRATPGRCPECGMVTATDTVQ